MEKCEWEKGKVSGRERRRIRVGRERRRKVLEREREKGIMLVGERERERRYYSWGVRTECDW